MKRKSKKKAYSKAKPVIRVDDMKALAAMSDDDINTSDIPEILDWSGAKRGLFYKPADSSANVSGQQVALIKHRLAEFETGAPTIPHERVVRWLKAKSAGKKLRYHADELKALITLPSIQSSPRGLTARSRGFRFGNQ